MRYFQKIAEGVNVAGVVQELHQHDYLWNGHKFRTTYEGTPHVDVDDIWLRFSPEEKLNTQDVTEVLNDTGGIVWYPPRLVLPSLKPIVLDLMRMMNGYELGRLLITRIVPGGRILPHADVAGEYVNLGDVQRYHVVLQGHPGSFFACGEADKRGETVQMLTGEVWWFDAHSLHEVHNRSDDDRIHLLVDMRIW